MNIPDEITRLIASITWIELQIVLLENEPPWIFTPYCFRAHRTCYQTAPEYFD